VFMGKNYSWLIRTYASMSSIFHIDNMYREIKSVGKII